jgi:hypothetical protein
MENFVYKFMSENFKDPESGKTGLSRGSVVERKRSFGRVEAKGKPLLTSWSFE